MANITHSIRPAPGGDGPFYVVSELDGSVTNVTLGLANLNAALDQCKTDAGPLVSGLTIKQVRIATLAE